MKTSTQLKALVRNLSRDSNIEAEVLLRNFMLERFLERIAISDYKQNFILKGGMLIAALVGIDTRTTIDMDATIKGQTLTITEINTIVETILRIPINDGVEFTVLGIEEIREGADYPGYRVSIKAIFDKTRQTLKVDITTGDYITPKEIEYQYKLMFEDRTINIMTYNLESILAEKFETIITRGITNTRMRDFYDVYILTTTRTFNKAIFRTALNKTVETRGTKKQMSEINEVIKMITESSVMISLWQKYRKKYLYAADVTWEMTIIAVKNLAGGMESDYILGDKK
ncbi:nucleotidyl transferase AbiEii/AbiGii toxin family protein [Treponema primitia]|uniref:nucleotidyl transferase AbiEii/AbiGii toxin family protein n=1 Tax=Treponema primitia TaxID=88058 RepID=UPI00025557BE|nr:nucleotidyl transferase AbiEii/AbiGii toxin family protein [Treponema primitia]